MAVAGDRPKAEKQLREITECSICMSAFTDPRMLPRIHTFCLECLKRTSETAQNKPGDKVPCPLCRKEFTIPLEGIVGLQRNFFIENLLENLSELKTTLQTKDSILKIGSEKTEEIRRMNKVNSCTKHNQKPLDYYCTDCKKIVCVSCVFESHKLHDCKDVTEVSFQATDLGDSLKNANSNFVGNVEETTTQFENCTIVVGLGFNPLTTAKEVFKINLNRSNEISKLEKIPTALWVESFAAVYCNTMYVVGAGFLSNQIWKYNTASGWKKCASMSNWRGGHSAAFIDEVLYICGGFVDCSKSVLLDSVEAYNAVTNKCTIVGKLAHPVENSGNCVPFKGSLYIFGGADKDNRAFNHVQVYNTKENTCSLLSRPMPRPHMMMRAVLWETFVILLGWETCFVFNVETEMWQERKQFKTDVVEFGFALENERVFVIGGRERDKHGKTKWKCRDDVRYVPLQNILEDNPIEWKIHGKLPKPSIANTCAQLPFLV